LTGRLAHRLDDAKSGHTAGWCGADLCRRTRARTFADFDASSKRISTNVGRSARPLQQHWSGTCRTHPLA